MRAFLSVVVLAALCGCGAGGEKAEDAGIALLDSGGIGRFAPVIPVGGIEPADDDAPFAAERAACAFKQGALPQDTFGPSIASANIPIDTIVIVSQENHSFDEYLGQLPAAGQKGANVENTKVKLTNANGESFSPFHEPALCTASPPHDWDSMHGYWDNGKNDGFLKVDGPTAYPTLGYYDASDLTFYYALATTYGVSDAYFDAVLGPTYPNRMYLYAGTSAGHVSNAYITLPASYPTIFQALKDANVSFGLYSNGPAGSMVGSKCPGPASFESMMFCDQTGPAKTFADFKADASAGTLPHVSWIYAGNDEHPSGDVEMGEGDVQSFFNLLAASPQWPRSAFIVTYDENGGFYDHVPPPSACLPDSTPPDIPREAKTPGTFGTYGFRVPFILASPYSKPHYVSHVVSSHTSILRFLELRFDLPACSDRDANADPLIDFFDFSRPPFATPTIPPAVIIANPSVRGC
jgi:phospholipase C